MNALNRFPLFLRISIMAILMTTPLACMSSGVARQVTAQPAPPTAAVAEASPPSSSSGQTCTLSVGDSSDAFSLTFSGKNFGDLASKNDLELADSILDFSLPGQKIAKLSRSDVGGKVLINSIDIHYSPDKDRTALVVRFATAGQGKGNGNIGLSLAYGLNLPGNIMAQIASAKPGSTLEGKLTTGSACAMAEDQAKADLQKLGVNAPKYTGLIGGAAETCASFKGFVLYTQVSDSADPYFEMLESESTPGWRLVWK